MNQTKPASSLMMSRLNNGKLAEPTHTHQEQLSICQALAFLKSFKKVLQPSLAVQKAVMALARTALDDAMPDGQSCCVINKPAGDQAAGHDGFDVTEMTCGEKVCVEPLLIMQDSC